MGTWRICEENRILGRKKSQGLGLFKHKIASHIIDRINRTCLFFFFKKRPILLVSWNNKQKRPNHSIYIQVSHVLLPPAVARLDSEGQKE